jgi:hypothetical protein
MTNAEKIARAWQARQLLKLGAQPPKPKDDGIARYKNGVARDPAIRKVEETRKRMQPAAEWDQEYFDDVQRHDAAFVKAHSGDMQILLEARRAEEEAAVMQRAAELHDGAPAMRDGEHNATIDAEISRLESEKRA